MSVSFNQFKVDLKEDALTGLSESSNSILLTIRWWMSEWKGNDEKLIRASEFII